MGDVTEALATAEIWLSEYLSPEVDLVPVPRSAPFREESSIWPALEICRELERRGLCREIQPLLARRTRIRKSGFLTRAADRPSPEEHIASLGIEPETSFFSDRITVVDDVITRGSQLLAAASCLAHRFPWAKIMAFAAIRTVSEDDIESFLQPAQGLISSSGANRLQRRP
ncbi:MAG: hypothetical protein IPN34_13340 [Planctomycetes bacterium]|nr:hypothetical protein [Planctomycetota bacterium]